MTADPRGVGAPSHWSHHRPAASPEEEAELGAVQFQPADDVERAIVVLEHPELAGDVLRHAALGAQAGSGYQQRRRAAIELLGWRPDPAIAADVEAAARALAELTPPTIVHDDAHREAFAKAVIAGSHGDQAVEFNAWLEDLAAAHAHAVRVARLRARLVLTGGGPGPAKLPPPTFTTEVDKAWRALASELHRRAAEPSRPPAEATRRVPPVSIDDSPSAALGSTDPAAVTLDGSGPVVDEASIATSPDAIRPADRDASSSRRSRGPS